MDLILTWPKKRALESYLRELERARKAEELAFFKVPTLPTKLATSEPRTYMLHDGAIRGYLVTKFLATVHPGGSFKDSVTGDDLAPGNYIVRDPKWHPIEPVPMKGFRGFRYMFTGLKVPASDVPGT